jgi:MFS transporter, OFA family, oxalate/formate antiporter
VVSTVRGTRASAGGVPNCGWQVTFVGMGINLALGVLFSWSVISQAVPVDWGWSETGRALPYSVACLVFSLTMVPAGRLQDRVGPRVVATVGGLLVGAGLILASLTRSLAVYVVGFGVLAGAGIGAGFASATPAAVKWFPAARTGLVTGLVVAGFGLSGVFVAPLANALIRARGVPATMLIFGVGFLVVVVALSQWLSVPPDDFAPPGSAAAPVGGPHTVDFTPGEVLRTRQFYVLWFVLACGAGAGLMVISKLARMVEVQTGITLGFLLVAVLALGNGGGRIAAGILSDRFGRKRTLLVVYLAQTVAILLLAAARSDNALGTGVMMAALSALIGANYGANLSLLPSVIKDYYGLKNFGVNYGLVFTAWGLGGFTLSLLAGAVFDRTHSFTFAYYGSAVMLVVATAATLLLTPPSRTPARGGRRGWNARRSRRSNHVRTKVDTSQNQDGSD